MAPQSIIQSITRRSTNIISRQYRASLAQDPHAARLQQLHVEVDPGSTQQRSREVAGLFLAVVDVHSELPGAHADHQPHARPRRRPPHLKGVPAHLEAALLGAQRDGVAQNDALQRVVADDAEADRAAGDEHFEVAGALRAGEAVYREVVLAHVQRLHRQLRVLLGVVHEDAGLKQLEGREVHPHRLQLAPLAQLLVAALDLLEDLELGLLLDFEEAQAVFLRGQQRLRLPLGLLDLPLPFPHPLLLLFGLVVLFLLLAPGHVFSCD